MKKLLAGVVAVLFVAPFIGPVQAVLAADARDTKAPVWKHGGQHETKDIIGTRIKNAEGKDVGEIDQLLIDRDGKVTHAVIGVGGLAGVGEKKVVVPWSTLKFAPVAQGKKNAIMINDATLASAPRYERASHSDVAPSASPRPADSDRDGKPDRTDKAPLDPSKQ